MDRMNHWKFDQTDQLTDRPANTTKDSGIAPSTLCGGGIISSLNFSNAYKTLYVISYN
jgi:hypothetical protein